MPFIRNRKENGNCKRLFIKRSLWNRLLSYRGKYYLQDRKKICLQFWIYQKQISNMKSRQDDIKKRLKNIKKIVFSFKNRCDKHREIARSSALSAEDCLPWCCTERSCNMEGFEIMTVTNAFITRVSTRTTNHFFFLFFFCF